MKVALGFVPFHGPTAPPLGLAALGAALRKARPAAELRLFDWNLELFRKWLLGEPPHLCLDHPDQGLGVVCPNLLVEAGRGQELWDTLRLVPRAPLERDRYMSAAVELDTFYATLRSHVEGLLRGWVEGKAALPRGVRDGLFGDALAELSAWGPDLLGLSVLTEQNLTWALGLARAAKAELGMSTALGGALTSHLEPSELLRAFPWIDFVMWGEAEETFPLLLDSLGRGTGREAVRGLAHRGENGEPCVHDDPPPPALDELADPDWSDFRLRDYLVAEPVLPVLSSRGCYWGRCTFCSHILPFAPGVRTRSSRRVVDELERLGERHGVRRFLFVDEAIAPKKLLGISQEILERGLELRFGAEGVRVEAVLERQDLAQAHAAGLRWVYVGVESATQSLLDRMDKGIEVHTIERFIDDCRAVGVVPALSFIVGVPGTRVEDLETEAAFMLRHPTDSGSFQLLLGSPVQKRPLEYGIRIEDRELLYSSRWGQLHSPRFWFTSPEGLSPVQADVLLEERTRAGRPRARPHVGEVHAVLLSNAGFFDSVTRPAPPELVEVRVLARLLEEPKRDADWALHAASCLEVAGDVEGAWGLVGAGLAAAAPGTAERAALTAHAIGLLVAASRYGEAVEAVSPEDLPGPAKHVVRGQRVRALVALDRAQEALAEIDLLLKAGYEPAQIHELRGWCLERVGRFEEAYEAYRAAELEDWWDPKTNESMARCLERGGQEQSAADQQREKAARKRRALP